MANVIRDAALASGTLLGVLAVGAAVSASPSIPAAAVGGMATVAAEWLAGRHEQAVRVAWERSHVRLGAVVGAITVVVALAQFAPDTAVSSAAGALLAYLALLALVQLGAVPPPRSW